MKTTQKLALLLSLIAIAPSYAAESSSEIKSSEAINCSHFRGIQNHIVFVDNRHHGAGDGSCAHPFSSLEEAELHSQPGQCIYVMATGRPYRASVGFGRSALITLKPNQCCVSSGCTIKIGNKEIPALTPGHVAEIFIEGSGPTTGILMSNCNQVAGFLFSGVATESDPGHGPFPVSPTVGIGSASLLGMGNNGSITKNKFQHLDYGVRLPIQWCSNLDVLSNQFSHIRDTALDLQTEEEVMVTIQDNSFEGASFYYVCCDPTPMADPAEGVSQRGQSVSSTGPTLASSDGAILSIEGNRFCGHAHEALFANGAKQLNFRHNHISDGVMIGLEIIQYTPIESLLCIENNQFDVTERNVLSLGNVNAIVKNNNFRGGQYGLGIFSFHTGGIAASVESNSFEHQHESGFCMDLLESRFSSCLRLVDNTSIKHFTLNNLYSDPALFQVAAKSHENLKKLNHGTAVAIEGEVSFVPLCLRCADSE